MNKIMEEIQTERERQKSLVFDGKPSTEFDKQNTESDWINYVVRYASGGAPKLQHRKDLEFRTAMIKAATLCIAAIEAKDAGYC